MGSGAWRSLPRVSARKTAAVLTLIPGMEVRTW